MQYSSVCSKFSEAAALIPILKCMDLKWSAENVKRLDSKLLLHWAKRVKGVDVSDTSIMIPGLSVFMEASGVTELGFYCDSPLTAAKADHLLSTVSFPALTTLNLWGFVKPNIFPLTVTQLMADFSCSWDGQPWDSTQADSLIYRCARLPALHKLFFSFENIQPPDDYMDLVRFSCPIMLPDITYLSVMFTLNDHTEIDLNWLHRQPCAELEVRVAIVTSDPARHLAVQQQLSGLRIHSLSVMLERESCWQAAQQFWSGFTCEEAHIHLSHHKVFRQPDQALSALPVCSGQITIWSGAEIDSGRFCITWAALARRGADIAINLGVRGELYVCAPKQPAPDSLRQPWQLMVQGARGVHGLPASQPTSRSYFLQNAAARAAGWTEQAVQYWC